MRTEALVPVIVIALAWLIFCFVDIKRHEVRYLPKWVWVIICCISIPLGGIIYLAVGRKW
jgi:hypothetical protein